MLRIHQAIQSGSYPNASTLARELEVSTKSIHRDLEFMRDRLELPMEYDALRYRLPLHAGSQLRSRRFRSPKANCSPCW